MLYKNKFRSLRHHNRSLLSFFKPFSLFVIGKAFQAVSHREVAHRGLLYCVVPPSLYEGYALQISSGVR